MKEFCLIFLVMTVIDIIYGIYIRKVAEGAALLAGALASTSLLLHGLPEMSANHLHTVLLANLEINRPEAIERLKTFVKQLKQLN